METCGGDPCATAAKLAQLGAGLTTHTVAFDLRAKDAQSIACLAGSDVSVIWTGPSNNNDYLTIVAKGAPDHVHDKYAYTRSGSPAKVPTSATPGPAEIRYLNGYDNRVLMRFDITLTPP